jgi:thiamine-phosphate pyrophosphorylase
MDLIIISPEQLVNNEVEIIKSLFNEGLQQFHIRKPTWERESIEEYLMKFSSKERAKMVLHSNYVLAEKYNLKGIQVGKDRLFESCDFQNKFEYVGYSAHSFYEINKLKAVYSNFFLSPIFNSISKMGYHSNFEEIEIKQFIQNNKDIRLIALGGVNHQNIKKVKELGFDKAALLGAIWMNNYPIKKFKIINKLII